MFQVVGNYKIRESLINLSAKSYAIYVNDHFYGLNIIYIIGIISILL